MKPAILMYFAAFLNHAPRLHTVHYTAYFHWGIRRPTWPRSPRLPRPRPRQGQVVRVVGGDNPKTKGSSGSEGPGHIHRACGPSPACKTSRAAGQPPELRRESCGQHFSESHQYMNADGVSVRTDVNGHVLKNVGVMCILSTRTPFRKFI